MCEMHIDSSLNGKSEDLSHLFVMSKMIWESKNVCGWHVTVVCHTCNSINTVLQEKKLTDGVAINHLIEVYSQFSSSR